MKNKNKEIPEVRTIAVVDGSNVMSKCERFNPKTGKLEVIRDWSIDLKKFYRYLTEQKGAKEVLFFGPYYPNNPKSQQLNRKLRQIGYKKRLRRAVPYWSYEYNREGELVKIKRNKANVDAMIPVDVLLRINEFDELLFCSGDGDFLYMLKRLIKRKKIVRVYAFGDVTSRDIKKYFKGDFIDLVDLKQMLGYRTKRR